MPAVKATAKIKPDRRCRTRYRGITYRERADGSRRYSVYFRGHYLPVEGGEKDALAKQAELRREAARGEKPAVSTKVTFTDVAEQWYGSKNRLRPYTLRGYRATLDRVLLPRFGAMKITA